MPSVTKTQDQIESNIDRIRADAVAVLSENSEVESYLNNHDLGDDSNAVYNAGYIMGLQRAIEVFENYED